MMLEPKAWYHFIKHSLNPTTHNENVNKQRLALLRCITVGYNVNVGKKEVPTKKEVTKKKKIENIILGVEEFDSDDGKTLNSMIKQVDRDNKEFMAKLSEKEKPKKVTAKKIIMKVVKETNE